MTSTGDNTKEQLRLAKDQAEREYSVRNVHVTMQSSFFSTKGKTATNVAAETGALN